MSIANQFLHSPSSYLYYSTFLYALDEISNELTRNQCQQYWLCLYQYFHYSQANKHELILEEKRLREALHQLDTTLICQHTKNKFRICRLLQRGQQVLSDLYDKYDKTSENLKSIDNLIPKLASDVYARKYSNMNPFLCQLSETVTNLQDQIGHLRHTRNQHKFTQFYSNSISYLSNIGTEIQEKLNQEKLKFLNMQIQVYRLQENLHKIEIELTEIQHTFRHNVQTNYERENQLTRVLQYQLQLTPTTYDLNLHQQNQDEIEREKKLFLRLNKENSDFNHQLLDYAKQTKMNQNRQIELHLKSRHLLEVLQTKRKEIEEENKTKQNLIETNRKLHKELKRKTPILSTQNRQNDQLKHRLHQLEQHRSKDLPIVSLNESIEANLHEEIKHHSQLTTTNHNLQHEIYILESTTKQYFSLVKEQREKILYYEKLHDQSIIHLNINRRRLLRYFQRLTQIDQQINQTKNYVNKLNNSLPNLATLEYDLHFYIQRRKAKLDGINTNTSNESQSLLKMKIHQLKRMFHSNQILSQEIQQKIALTTNNTSLISNQIIRLDKQKSHLSEYLQSLHKKSFLIEHQFLNIFKQLHHINHVNNLHNANYQQSTQQKYQIAWFLLVKQRSILQITKQIQNNQTTLRKRHGVYQELLQKIQQIRNRVLMNKPMKMVQSCNLKQMLLHLQVQLFEWKKRTADHQHQIHRQKLINSHEKSSLQDPDHYYWSTSGMSSSLGIIFNMVFMFRLIPEGNPCERCFTKSVIDYLSSHL
ncbi:unnamed protein product [Adineta ricciae]|uniref:Uncharacterized protein n=1 Tax=Adineta ricciae TaxID=249248 RepID=A0A813Z0T9_ADIRI|nr:unnamed protein product [Adineta ricciae]